MSEQRQPGWYWEKKKDSPLLKWQPAEYCSEYGWMPREPEIIGPRIPRRGSGGHHRIIRDPEGRVVLQDSGHEGEMEWIRTNLEGGTHD